MIARTISIEGQRAAEFMRAFTPKRWELLEVLKRNSGQSINQLAQLLGTKTSTPIFKHWWNWA